jgi:hypothetical protein
MLEHTAGESRGHVPSRPIHRKLSPPVIVRRSLTVPKGSDHEIATKTATRRPALRGARARGKIDDFKK